MEIQVQRWGRHYATGEGEGKAGFLALAYDRLWVEAKARFTEPESPPMVGSGVVYKQRWRIRQSEQVEAALAAWSHAYEQISFETCVCADERTVAVAARGAGGHSDARWRTLYRYPFATVVVTQPLSTDEPCRKVLARAPDPEAWLQQALDQDDYDAKQLVKLRDAGPSEPQR